MASPPAPVPLPPDPMDLDVPRRWFVSLQDAIVAKLAAIDGGSFRRDAWTRPEGGGGIARVIEEGTVFERGGVNYSHVSGARLPPSATAARPELADDPRLEAPEVIAGACDVHRDGP